MRLKVLISYTSDLEDDVECLAQVLRAIDFEVVFYRDKEKQGWSSASSSWVSDFRRHTESADIFLQVIANKTLGSKMQLEDGSSEPSIRAEFKIYRSVYRLQGSPIFLGFYRKRFGEEASLEVTTFLDEIGASAEKFLHFAKTSELLALATRRALREGKTHRRIIKGVLVPGSECSDILKKVMAHIHSQETFPQKYLYATLRGACLWRWLASPESGSTIAGVYANSPFRKPYSEIYKAISSAVKRVAKDAAKGEEELLGVMVLGCGDGKREADLCGRFLDDGIATRLRVVLVDVSSELIEPAVREFDTWIDRCEVSFAVLDFEDLTALRQLRSGYLGALPVVAMLLGNTLGNVDERQMLSEIVRALEPNDYVLAEMLLCKASDAKPRQTEEHPIGDDKRFEFITTPLRLLGIEPQRGSLRRLVAVDGEGKITQTFRYQFTELDRSRTVEDQVTGQKCPLSRTSWIDLLEIKAVTKPLLEKIGKDAGLSDPVVFVEKYATSLGQQPLCMGYLLGRVCEPEILFSSIGQEDL